MCRHLGWLGEARSVASLILDPPQALLVQSYAPARQQHGLLNADGWGVGFWPDSGADPPAARWRSTRPLWQDASLASVAPVLAATCVVAAVRSATVGMPIDEAATAPFAHGRWLISHNGTVDRIALAEVATQLGVREVMARTAESVCDAAQLAALVAAAGLERLPEVVLRLGAADPRARLNLLLADGEQLIATTWGDTLSLLVTERGTVLASEPYDDDPGWQDIADRQIATVSRGTTNIRNLDYSENITRM